MKLFASIGMIAFLIPLATFAARCPAVQESPTLPDGATASREQMLDARKAVSYYNAVVTEYVECLQKNGGSAADGDLAVDKLHEVANQFNAALRVFKMRGSH